MRIFCFSSAFSFDGSIITPEKVFTWAAKNDIDVLLLSDTTLCGIGNFILQSKLFPSLKLIVGIRLPDQPHKTYFALTNNHLEGLVKAYNLGDLSGIKELPSLEFPPAQYLPGEEELWNAFQDILYKLKGQKIPVPDEPTQPRVIDTRTFELPKDLTTLFHTFGGYNFNPNQRLPKAPDGFIETFVSLTHKGTQRERALKEIEVIKKKHFEDYFFTIYKIVELARKHDILLGPGRGSAVGSYLLHLMGVTSVDPLEYGLLFERFLNEGRQDYPDVDVDVEDERRQELIELLRKEFGYVYHISAFSTLPAKFLEGLPEKIVDELRTIPVSRTTHAAGLIISTVPLNAPISPGTNTLEWDMETLEKLGFVKIDVLGLKTLSVFKELKLKTGLEHIPVNDRNVFRYLSTGFTDNVFQLDSKLGKMVVRDVRPTSLSELALAISLNRPGPIKAGITERIRKVKKEKRRLFEINILNETFGFPLYQEQVMLIALQLAGMTPAEADTIRRAISKGDITSFRELYERLERSLTTKFGRVGKELSRMILAFGEYTFNKSHAIAYAHLTYYMAYFKVNHPRLFYTVYLKHDTSVLEDAVYNLQTLGYRILPPTVRLGKVVGKSDEDVFHLPFQIVPGISPVKAEELEQRIFASFEEFVESSGLSISTIEALIKVGAFDNVFESRRRAIQKLRTLRTGLNPEAQRLARLFGKRTEESDTKVEEVWERTLMEHETIGVGLTPPVDCQNSLAPYCLAYSLDLPYAVHIRIKAGFATDGVSVFKLNAPDGAYTLVYPSKLYEGFKRVIYLVEEISPAEVSKLKATGGYEKIIADNGKSTTVLENARPLLNRFETQILD
ncbi:DNA polymerase III subunit alpha [Fervidobacterium thailandense]|uniref:DNA polymerase III subunit alpha n=1 Tax=Fervidobacterium thailandense TaxID=1008305 RepID=UPI000A5F8BD5|nr:DNA polymerase III subunit alpha [Fervidobacterium thailandense]